MESMGFVVRFVNFDAATKDLNFDIDIRKGRTTWTIRRPEKSLSWLEERMRARRVRGIPKYKPKRKLRPGATEAEIAALQREVEDFLAALIGVVSVENIPMHMPLRSWFEIDEEGKHGQLKQFSGINERAVAVVRALVDYTGRDDRELTFAANDVISIVDNTSDTTWWRGKMGTRVGLVPASMVEVISKTGTGRALSKDEQIGGFKLKTDKPLLTVVRATADYTGDASGSTVSFRAGEIIGVITQSDDGWWEGVTQDGRTGWLPSSYTESAMGGSTTKPKISAAAALELELCGAKMPGQSAAPASRAPAPSPGAASRAPPPSPGAASRAPAPSPAAASRSPAAAAAPVPWSKSAAAPSRAAPAAPAAPAASAYATTADDDYGYYEGAGASAAEGGTPAVMLYAYSSDELTLAAGDPFWVNEDHGDGWTSGWDANYAYGAVPSSYVQIE